ncbi:Dot/Icm T4SS effector AnkI/LegAS4 [Legionella fallonii]|uniref:Dot/Icm T4SS effector [ank repeat + set domain] n=1 Tax=Legionella fallonii LLAP-10 TaxID=1212491 RepID=A0A098G4F0_9GAMM|nr:Dot/Icm T4SS effector AnkI/LegAS4 [Legionella fallonii]CEG56864.1 Dot/Icm T4SS effector [ank repeat + set domain] [Legionella fallonii LLAP-10]
MRVIWSDDEPSTLQKFNYLNHKWEDSFSIMVSDFDRIVEEQQQQNKTSTAPPFKEPLPQHPILGQQHFKQQPPTKRSKIEEPISSIPSAPSQVFPFTPSEIANLFATPDELIQPPIYWTPLPASSTDTFQKPEHLAESMEQGEGYWCGDKYNSAFGGYPFQKIFSEVIEISDDEETDLLSPLTDEKSLDAAGEKEDEQPKIATKSTDNASATTKHSFFSSKQKGKEKVKDCPEYEEKMKLMEELGIDNMTPEDYIPTDLDKPNLVYVGKVDLLKNFGGRGLFAKQDIPANTCIGVYTGERFASKEEFDTYLSEHPDKNNNYAMNVGKKVVDAAVKGNFTRYANFSDSQENAFYQLDIVNEKTVVTIITNRAIKKDEQILVNYNEYKPEISESYCFLNPEDGCHSAQELHCNNGQHYSLLPIDSPIELLKLEKDECLYAASIGKLVFANKPLPKKITCPVDLLFLRTNSQHDILDFDKADTFTPLMLACYKGQLANVQTLMKHKANVNRQQHSTGNCPLFFALAGYAEQTSASKKALYLKILTHLIDHGANILTHDRHDMTFIHKAIATLSTEDFKSLVSFLHKKHRKNFTRSFDYITVDDFDNVLYCLSIKSLDKAEILLNQYPKSFKENCNRKNKEETIWYVEAFQKIIQDYNESEKEMLLVLLNKYNAPAELIDMLNVTQTRQNSPIF